MAGLLDVFTIGFNSDGLKDFEKNLRTTEKELDKAEKELKELQREFKFTDDTAQAAKLDEKIQETEEKVKSLSGSLKVMKSSSENTLLSMKKNFTSLVKTLGTLAIAGIALKKSLDFYEQGEQLDFLAQKTNIAVDKLQLLANVAKKYGGTTEGIAGSVEGLNSKEGRQKATKAGITVSDDAEKTLDNIARKMETLGTNAKKLELAKTLGLDEATTRMVLEGTTKLNEQLKRAKKYQLFTPEDIQRMREYREIETDIRLGVENIFGSIWRMLLPAITAVGKAIRKVTDWFAEHEGAVKIIATFVAIVAAIAAVVSIIQVLNGAIALVMANPVVLIILGIAAAITALIAIINDLIVFMEGGDSIIEELFNKWGLNTELLRQDLKNLTEGVKTYVTQWIEGCRIIGEVVDGLVQKVKSLWEIIPEPLRKIMGGSFKLATTMANPIGMPIAIGQTLLNRYKNNETNAVPNGAIANYNQTQSINNNNAANTQSINNNNSSNIKNLSTATATTSRKISIQKVEINAQGADAQGVYNQFLNTASGLDNGMRA